MGLDVTSLAVVVESKGIDPATKSLNSFVLASENAEKATANLAKSEKSAVSDAEKYLQKLNDKANLLGKSVQAVSEYTMAQKTMDNGMISAASTLGKSVDLYAQKLISQKRDIEATNQQGKAYAEAQAEALKMNAALDSKVLGQKAVEQTRDVELSKLQAKAYADVQAEAIKLNRTLDASTAAYAKAQAEAIKMNVVMDTSALFKAKAASQNQDIQLHSMQSKAYADTHAEALKMNAAMDAHKISADKAKLSTAGFTGSLEDAHAAARGFSGALGALWTTYGSVIPLAAGLAIGAGMKGIIEVGKNVENALEGIRVRGQETLASIDAMRTAIMDMGKGIYGPKEVADAFDVLILAGLNAKQALVAVHDAINLALVGGTSVEKAATSLVQIGTAINYTAEGYSRIADVIAMTAAASISTVESVSNSFKSGAAVNKLYGVSLVDMGTAFAMLSNLGIKDGSAGTNLKNFYSYLADGTKKVTDGLGQIGLKMSDLKTHNGDFKPMVEVFQTLSDHLNTLTEANQKLVISMITNKQGSRFMVEGLSQIRAAGVETATSMEDLRKKIDESWGLASMGAAAMALTVDAQFKSVKNTLETQFLAAFQDIQPQLSVIATSLKAAFNSPEFTSGIQSMALALANLAVFLVENTGMLKAMFEAFLLFKGISTIIALFTGTAQALIAVSEGFAAARLGALAFQISLGVVGVALAAAGALWVYYANKKDEALNKPAQIQYMDDFIGKLDEEKKRLDKQLELMQLGKTAREAETEAMVQQQIALVKLNGERAVADKVKDVVALKDDLSASDARALARAKEMGLERINGLGEVNKILAAERAVADTIKLTTERYGQAVIAAQGVRDVNEKIATEAQKQADKKRENDKAGLGEITPKLTAEQKAWNKELEQNERLLGELKATNEQYKQSLESVENGGKKETAAEIALIKARQQLDTILDSNTKQYSKLDRSRAFTAVGLAVENVEMERYIAANVASAAVQKEVDAAYAKSIEKREQAIQKLKDENTHTQNLIATYGMSKGAIEDLELAEAKANLTGEAGLKLNKQEYDLEVQRIAQLQQRASLRTNLGAVEQPAKDAKLAAKYWEDAANSISKGLSDAFGKAGKAAGDMFKVFAQGNATQIKLEAERVKEVKLNGKTEQDVTAINADFAERSTQARLSDYADMSSAAAGFFDAQSGGYKVLMGVSKAFHIAEVALQLATIPTKLAAGAATMFGQSGWGGFAGVAAMGAVMAGLGFAMSGGSSGVPISQQRQTVAGTGTVLGSNDAKSASIDNSLKNIEKNSGLSLVHSQEMVNALNTLVSTISNLSSLVVRTSGLTPNAVAGVTEGTDRTSLGSLTSVSVNLIAPFITKIAFIDNLITKLFGTTTSVVDQGIAAFSGTLANVEKIGIQAQSYAEINSKTKILGFTVSDKTSTQLTNLPKEVGDQLALIVTSMAKSVSLAADALGLGGDAFTEHLKTFVVDIGQISIKGLTGDQIQAQFQTIFSKMGDDMAKFAVEGLSSFTKVGEGYLDTLTRVANDLIQVQDVYAVLGQNMNATGLDAVNLSESLIASAGGIDKLTSGTKFFIDNFLTDAERLAPIAASVQKELDRLGLSSVTTVEQFKEQTLAALAAGAGGQDLYAALLNLAPAFSQVHQEVKSAQAALDERKSLQDKYDNLVMTSDQLRAKERATIDSTNLDLYDAINLETDRTAALDASNKAAADALAIQQAADAKAKGYQDQLDNLTMSQAQLRDKERIGLDATSLALYNQVKAHEDLAQWATEAANAVAAQVASDQAAKQAADAQHKTYQDQLDNLTMTQAQLRDKERIGLDATSLALYNQVKAQEDLKQWATEAATALQAQVASQQKYQDQLDSLTMNQDQLRAKERAGLDEVSAAIFDHINAIEDAKTAITDLKAVQDAATKAQDDYNTKFIATEDKRNQMFITYLQLSGDATGALQLQRSLELNALDATLQPLQKRIYTLQDEATAATAAATAAANLKTISDKQRSLDIALMTAQGDATGALNAQREDELAALLLLSPALIDTQKQIYAATDAAKAKADADALAATAKSAADAAAANLKTIADKQRSLDIALMTAQGNATGALNAQREDELAALILLSPALADTQKQIYAATDAAKAQADATAAAATALADYNTAVTNVQTAQATVTSNLASLATAVKDFADKAAAADTALATANQNITDGYLAAQDGLAAAQANVASIADKSATAMKAFAVSIGDFLDTLNTTTLGSGSPTTQLQALRDTFMATAQAAQGGDTVAQGKLTNDASAFLQASKSYNASGSGFTDDEAMVKSVLGGIKSAAESGALIVQMSPEMVTAQQAVAAAQDKLAAYALLAQLTNSSIERGVTGTALEIKNLLDAYNLAATNQATAQADYKASLELTKGMTFAVTDSLTGIRAGVDAYNASIVALANAANALASATIAKAAIPVTPIVSTPVATTIVTTPNTPVSTSVLNASADALAAYKDWDAFMIAGGAGDFAAAQKDSYIQTYMNSISGSHRNGLDSVPYDGYVAELHKGERVQTSAQATASDELVQLTKDLIAKISNVEDNTSAALNQQAAIAEQQAEQMAELATAQEATTRALRAK